MRRLPITLRLTVAFAAAMLLVLLSAALFVALRLRADLDDQINNNLRVTYSTNLSQDQNQVLAFEYRVSNKLAFFAQYEQRSLSNVTNRRDNFSFGIRLRRRF